MKLTATGRYYVRKGQKVRITVNHFNPYAFPDRLAIVVKRNKIPGTYELCPEDRLKSWKSTGLPFYGSEFEPA